MNEQEAELFYKKQYQMVKNVMDFSIIPEEYVTEIIEQVGLEFSSVLELGAGNGALARGLSQHTKEITTIELVSEIVDDAKQFEVQNITSLIGSFYEIELDKNFDLVVYMDGFGVGSNEEQLFLLKRIYKWLTDDGVALIDIFQPKYWQKTKGVKMTPNTGSTITRVYGYEETSNQLTDTWWKDSNPETTYTQTLACYSPDEIYELCKEANLKIIAYYPGGAMDFDKWIYNDKVSLSECLSFRIKIVKM